MMNTESNMVKIEGETYPHRNVLKKIGAVYRKPEGEKRGAWWIAADKIEQANSIVSGTHQASRDDAKQRAKARYWAEQMKRPLPEGQEKPKCKCMNCGAEIASGYYCANCK